jgi:dTMP kinase
MSKNLFIALEGIDGSGKSTQVQLLAKALEEAGHKVYATFEPTDSPIGKMIRDIFSGRMQADDKVIAALFVADRLDHLLNKETGLLKKMEEGYTVITDRYYFSSYAYHAVHMPLQWVIDANALSAAMLRPDINIYIDIAPEESMARITRNRTTIELYETTENLRSVRTQYMAAFGLLKDAEEVFITDGHRPPGRVAADIKEKVLGMLAANSIL